MFCISLTDYRLVPSETFLDWYWQTALNINLRMAFAFFKFQRVVSIKRNLHVR